MRAPSQPRVDPDLVAFVLQVFLHCGYGVTVLLCMIFGNAWTLAGSLLVIPMSALWRAGATMA